MLRLIICLLHFPDSMGVWEKHGEFLLHSAVCCAELSSAFVMHLFLCCVLFFIQKGTLCIQKGTSQWNEDIASKFYSESLWFFLCKISLLPPLGRSHYSHGFLWVILDFWDQCMCFTSVAGLWKEKLWKSQLEAGRLFSVPVFNRSYLYVWIPKSFGWHCKTPSKISWIPMQLSTYEILKLPFTDCTDSLSGLPGVYEDCCYGSVKLPSETPSAYFPCTSLSLDIFVDWIVHSGKGLYPPC